MALKGRKPEIVEAGKPKFMISGRSGVGKTTFALDFPSPYYIDTEGGAVRKQYIEKLIANGGAYMGKEDGSQNFKDVVEEIKELGLTKHKYKTLVIDSFSHLYNLEAAIAEDLKGNEFGRDKKEANRPSRQLLRWIDNLDMTVILICHHKDKWIKQGKETVNAGTTFDGYDKLEYNLDLWLEIEKSNNVRSMTIKKSRISTLVEGDQFKLSYDKFAELYGKDIIEKEAVPINLAPAEKVSKLTNYINVVRVDETVVKKWLDKANADSLDQMTESQIDKCIEYVEKMVSEVKK